MHAIEYAAVERERVDLTADAAHDAVIVAAHGALEAERQALQAAAAADVEARRLRYKVCDVSNCFSREPLPGKA